MKTTLNWRILFRTDTEFLYAFHLAAFILAATLPIFSQVILNEVMFDPLGSEYSDEFVEIVNLSTADSVDLTGWHLSDGFAEDGLADAGEGMLLLPGQYAVILDPDYFVESASYCDLIPEEALIVTINGSTFGSRGFSNSAAETIVLIDSEGLVRVEYTYSIGNTSGHSDEKININGPDREDNWADSCVLMGTPGFKNSVLVSTFSDNVKLLVSPNPFSPDGDGYEDVTQINYFLTVKTSHVNLRIFDVYGRCVRKLLGAFLSGSEGLVIWDGMGDHGNPLRIGIYIIVIEALDSRAGLVVSGKTTVVVARSL
jgi:hypothetical protein